MWLVSGMLLIAFASYVALPLGLAWYMPQLAARHGVLLEVDRVRVEPFRSRIILHGVGVATSGSSSVRWSSIAARFDLAELLSGRLALDDFRLSEANLHAGDPSGGVDGVLAGLPAVLPGAVSVGELVVDSVELGAISRATGLRVAIDWLRVASLDGAFRPEGAEVEADLSVGEGRVGLHGRINLDDGGWILGAEVSAKAVPLEGFPALFAAGGTWRGRLGGAGPVRVVYSPDDGALSATTRGRWAIDAPRVGLARMELSGARVDWNGTAFFAASGDAVDGLGAAGEIGIREPRIEVAGVLEAEATELVLRVDVSRAPETLVAVDGRIPVLRLDGTGGAFEAVGARAGNVVSQIALTFADAMEAHVETLKVDTLDVELSDDRSIDLEQVELSRVSVAWNAGIVSAAAGTAERVDWEGLSGPRGTGTAARVAVEGVERMDGGELRFARASAETVSDRNGGSDLRLHEAVLESGTVSPAGSISVGRAGMSDGRLAGAGSTLVLEDLGLDGVEWDESGVATIESGRARVVDHTRSGLWAAIGTGLELAGGGLSDGAWTARSVRLAAVDVGTPDASWALHGLALADAAGEGERVSAGLAVLKGIELGFDGHRVVVEDLSADSPTWHEGVLGAQAIGAVSTAFDTVQRDRWHSGAWRLSGFERAVSGRARADTASLESLVLAMTGGSKAGALGVEVDGLSFDGESAVNAAGVVAERAYHRTSDGDGVDVAGLSAGGVEWNGEALAVERGAAPLLSVAAAPVRASFDDVALTSARFGADGAYELAALSSASGRGGLEQAVVEWSMETLTLDGYRAGASSGATIDFVDIRTLDLFRTASEARLHADRATARTVHVTPSGDTALAEAEVHGVTVRDMHGRDGISARALRASPLAIRESTLEIGTLSLSGVDSAVAVSEAGAWELPALPIGTGGARSSFTVRIQEAGTAEAGSVVRITDRTTKPAFTETFAIDRAWLRGFDPAAIGVPARFSVEATAGILTALHADGALVPTLTGTDLDLAATVRGVSLRELSPYARLHLGRTVERGHADVVVDATVRTSDLEGVADVAMSDVVLGESGPPTASEPGTIGAAAVGAALETLTDERGRIELRVPLGGQLDAPGFDLDALVARALARAAVAAAQTSPGGE